VLAAVRTGFGVDAFIRQAQAFHGPAADQVLLDNLRRVSRLHVAVPDGFWINDNGGAVLALVKASRLVDPDLGAEASGFGELLQLGEELALSI
jgi:hypothetical protein